MSKGLNALLPLMVLWSVGLAVIAVVLIQDVVPTADLFMDATFVGGQKWYVGMVAALGMIAWTASVCFCFMTGWVAGLAGRTRAQSAFRGGGLLFALLLLDDLFLFHSDLLPRSLGVPKLWILTTYGLFGLAWAVTSRDELVRTRVQFLVGAGLAFAISLSVEVVFSGADTGLRGVLEDGPKFLGILALALWSATSATDVIRSVVTSTGDQPLAFEARSRRPSAVVGSPMSSNAPTEAAAVQPMIAAE